MTDIIFTNTGYHENIKEYAKIIEQKIGKKLNYNKENDYYYYVIYCLDDLLDIVDVVEYECILYKSGLYENDDYVLEVYDDWRE